MNKKTTDIVAYLSWLGLLIAFLAGDREASRFHLNQALVLQLTATVCGLVLGWIPLIGWMLKIIAGFYLLACWLIGFVAAIQGQEKEVPFLGQIRLLQ